MSLRGSVAIVGAADTAVGRVPDRDATQLCAEAALRALADAGLRKEQIDGLVTCNSMAQPRMYHAEAIAEYLQIFPRWCLSANAGGGTTFSVFAIDVMTFDDEARITSQRAFVDLTKLTPAE